MDGTGFQSDLWILVRALDDQNQEDLDILAEWQRAAALPEDELKCCWDESEDDTQDFHFAILMEESMLASRRVRYIPGHIIGVYDVVTLEYDIAERGGGEGIEFD